MKLTRLEDVQDVINTIIEEEIHLEHLTKDDIYLIEKITDVVFMAVRKRQLENEDFNLKGRE